MGVGLGSPPVSSPAEWARMMVFPGAWLTVQGLRARYGESARAGSAAGPAPPPQHRLPPRLPHRVPVGLRGALSLGRGSRGARPWGAAAVLCTEPLLEAEEGGVGFRSGLHACQGLLLPEFMTKDPEKLSPHSQREGGVVCQAPCGHRACYQLCDPRQASSVSEPQLSP